MVGSQSKRGQLLTRAMRKQSVVSRNVENTKNSAHFDKQGREMKEKT